MINKFSEKCLAAAQAIVEKKGEQWTGGIACGSYITPAGKPNQEGGYRVGRTGTVCHSFMLHYEGHGKEPFIFVNVMKSSKMLAADRKNGNCEAFVRFMCQTGPFRNFIINGNKIDELMDGGVMIDCLAAGNNVTLFIAKTLRILYEDKYRVAIWKKFVDKGVHPMLALNFAMCVTEDMRLMGGQTHNSTMVPMMKKDAKLMFVDHLPTATRWYEGDEPNECTARVFAPNAKGMDDAYYNPKTYVAWPTEHLLPVNNKGGQTVKVPDGWGGYTTKTVNGGEDDIAKKLIELQEKYA